MTNLVTEDGCEDCDQWPACSNLNTCLLHDTKLVRPYQTLNVTPNLLWIDNFSCYFSIALQEKERPALLRFYEVIQKLHPIIWRGFCRHFTSRFEHFRYRSITVEQIRSVFIMWDAEVFMKSFEFSVELNRFGVTSGKMKFTPEQEYRMVCFHNEIRNLTDADIEVLIINLSGLTQRMYGEAA